MDSMKASDIAIAGATVGPSDTVGAALRVMAEHQLPGLIMVDAEDRPRRVIPGTQVLRMAIPDSLQDDTALVRAMDEHYADQFWIDEDDRPIIDCISKEKAKPGTVTRDATLLEVAVTMADLHSPLVAVVDAAGRHTGTVTLGNVLRYLTLPQAAD